MIARKVVHGKCPSVDSSMLCFFDVNPIDPSIATVLVPWNKSWDSRAQEAVCLPAMEI